MFIFFRQTCAVESAAKISGRQSIFLIWSPHLNICKPQVLIFVKLNLPLLKAEYYLVSSPIFPCLFVCCRPACSTSSSPLYDGIDHTNQIFSDSVSFGDDNDQDKDIVLKGTMYAIILKSSRI